MNLHIPHLTCQELSRDFKLKKNVVFDQYMNSFGTHFPRSGEARNQFLWLVEVLVEPKVFLAY